MKYIRRTTVRRAAESGHLLVSIDGTFYLVDAATAYTFADQIADALTGETEQAS